MSQQTMTLEQIRAKGLAVLSKHLGVVGMVRFLQQSETGWGNYTEERYQWLGDPDLSELAKKIQTRPLSPHKPNIAVEPTASSFGSVPLRLRCRRRLTASVRPLDQSH